MSQHRECCCDPEPFTIDCLHLDKIFIHPEDEPQWINQPSQGVFIEGDDDSDFDHRDFDSVRKHFSVWTPNNGFYASANPWNRCPGERRPKFRSSSWQFDVQHAGGNWQSQKNISGMGCLPCNGSLILSFQRKRHDKNMFGFKKCSITSGCVTDPCGNGSGGGGGGGGGGIGEPLVGICNDEPCDPKGQTSGCPSESCLCQAIPGSETGRCRPSSGYDYAAVYDTTTEYPIGGGVHPQKDVDPKDRSSDVTTFAGEGCDEADFDDPFFDNECAEEIIYDYKRIELQREETFKSLFFAYKDYWYLDLGAPGVPYAMFDESKETEPPNNYTYRIGPQPRSGNATFGCGGVGNLTPASPIPVDCNWLCNPDLKKTTCQYTPWFYSQSEELNYRTPNSDPIASFNRDAGNAGVGPDIQSHLPWIFSSLNSNGNFPLGGYGDDGVPLYPGGFSSYQMYMMQKNPTTRALAGTISFADGSNFFRGLNPFGYYGNCELTELDDRYTNLYSGYVGTMHRVRLWVRSDMVLLDGGTKYPCTEGFDGSTGDDSPGSDPNGNNPVAFYPPRSNENFFRPTIEGGYSPCVKRYISPSMFLYFCSGAPVYYHELEELAEESGNGFTETAKEVISRAWLNKCSFPGIDDCNRCFGVPQNGDPDQPLRFACDEELLRCSDQLADAVDALGQTGKYAVKDWRHDQEQKFLDLEAGFRQAADTYREDIINDLGEEEAETVLNYLQTFNIPSSFMERIRSTDTELLPVQKSNKYMLPYYISQQTEGADGNPYTLGEGERYKFSGEMSNYQAVAPDTTDVEVPTKFTLLERADPWIGRQILGLDRRAPSTWRLAFGSGNRDFEFNYPIQEQWDAWYQSGQIPERVIIPEWEKALYELWYKNIPVYFHAVPGGWTWSGYGQGHDPFRAGGRTDPTDANGGPPNTCNWFNNPSGGGRNLGRSGMNHPYKLNFSTKVSCPPIVLRNVEPFPNLMWADPNQTEGADFAYISAWLQPRDKPAKIFCQDVDDLCWGCVVSKPECTVDQCLRNKDLKICCEQPGQYIPKFSGGGTIESCVGQVCNDPGGGDPIKCAQVLNPRVRSENICRTGRQEDIPIRAPGCQAAITYYGRMAGNYNAAQCGSTYHRALGGPCLQNYYQAAKGGFRNVKFSSENTYSERNCPNPDAFVEGRTSCCYIKYGCPQVARGIIPCDFNDIGEQAFPLHRRENEHVVNVYPHTVRCAQTSQIDGLQRCGLLEKELQVTSDEFIDNYLPSVLVGLGDPLACNNLVFNPRNSGIREINTSCGNLDRDVTITCGDPEDDELLCPTKQPARPVTEYEYVAGEEDPDDLSSPYEFKQHGNPRLINKGSMCMKLTKNHLFIAGSYRDMFTPGVEDGLVVNSIPEFTCPKIGLYRNVEIDRPGALKPGTFRNCAEFYKDKRLADLDTFYQEPPMTTALTFSDLGGVGETEFAQAFVSTGDIPESHWLRRKVQGLESIKLFSVGDFNIVGGFSGGVNREDVTPGNGAGSFAGTAVLIFGSTADQDIFDGQNGWKNLKFEFFPEQPGIPDELEQCTYFMKPSLNPFVGGTVIGNPGEGSIDPDGCIDGAGLTFANKQQGNGDHLGKVYEFMKDPATPSNCDLIQPPIGSPVGFPGPISLNSDSVPFTVNIYDCYTSCISQSNCESL